MSDEKCQHDWTNKVPPFKYPRKCVKCGVWDFATEENELEIAEGYDEI